MIPVSTSQALDPSKPLLVSQAGASLDHPTYAAALRELVAQGYYLHLDVGAGTGENVVYATTLGLRSIGLEYDPDYARLIVGTVVRGSAESLPFRSGVFDVISLMHVLEHVP
jgi:SAM-dependent methyltransferase